MNMQTLTQKELNQLLKRYDECLRNDAAGKSPVFAGMDLSGLELKKVNLYHADFRGCNLKGCSFRYSDLGYANLEGADLTGADFRNVNLFRANLRHAVLSDICVNECTMFYFSVCPSEGSFIGYKKAVAGQRCAIVKLYIPEDAKRNSATSYRCRADRARVLEIVDETGKVLDRAWSGRDETFVYEAGKWLEVADFDPDRWNEKTRGIHFYLSKEIAMLY